MKRALLQSVRTLGAIAALGTAAGCSPAQIPYQTEDDREVYGVSVRKYAPDPVYKRTRLVHLPAPLPARGPAYDGAPLMLPVIHLELQDTTLEEASKILAESTRYRSYCASTIADKRVTLTTLGTVDELAARLSSEAGVHAVVDHHNKEVRFLARAAKAVEPRLSDEKVSN